MAMWQPASHPQCHWHPPCQLLTLTTTTLSDHSNPQHECWWQPPLETTPVSTDIHLQWLATTALLELMVAGSCGCYLVFYAVHWLLSPVHRLIAHTRCSGTYVVYTSHYPTQRTSSVVLSIVASDLPPCQRRWWWWSPCELSLCTLVAHITQYSCPQDHPEPSQHQHH